MGYVVRIAEKGRKPWAMRTKSTPSEIKGWARAYNKHQKSKIRILSIKRMKKPSR